MHQKLQEMKKKKKKKKKRKVHEKNGQCDSDLLNTQVLNTHT